MAATFMEAKATTIHCISSDKFGGDGVGVAQAATGELKTVAAPLNKFVGEQLCEVAVFHQLGGNAVEHSQAEGDALGAFGFLGEMFFVAAVSPASKSDGGNGAGTEAKVVFALPVGEVVNAFSAGLGEVADLVVMITGSGECGDESLVHRPLEFVVELDAAPKCSVLFERETVGGDVFGAEREGAVERVTPLRHRLAGQAEHEVEVEVRKTGVAEKMKCVGRLRGGVDAAKHGEHGVVEGLDAERETIHTGALPEGSLFSVNGGGVAFDGELGGRAWEFFEQSLPERRRQDARCATTDEEGLELKWWGAVETATDGFDIVRHLGFAAGVRVESAVPALRHTKRHMDVEVRNHAAGYGVSPTQFGGTGFQSPLTSRRNTSRVRELLPSGF